MRYAIDCETTGLDPYHGSKPFMVSITTEEGTNFLWEWEVDLETRHVNIHRDDIEDIQAICLDPKLIPIGHNIIFDVQMLRSISIFENDEEALVFLDRCHDTLLMSHAFNSQESHGLKPLCEKYLHIDSDDETLLEAGVKEAQKICRKLGLDIQTSYYRTNPSQKKKTWKGDAYLINSLYALLTNPDDPCFNISLASKLEPYKHITAAYATRDTERTFGLFEFYKEQFDIATSETSKGFDEIPDYHNAYEINRSLLPIIYHMQSNGIAFDCEKAKEMRQAFQEQANEAISNVKKLTKGLISNVQADTQIIRYLYHIKKYNPPKHTAKGNACVDVVSLHKLSDQVSKEDAKIIEGIKRAKQAIKASDTLLTYINCTDENLILHGNFNPVGTGTTRLSSNSPNLQNIATNDDIDLRGPFIPCEGRVLYSLDYSNIELRIPAVIGNDKVLLECFAKGLAMHMEICKMLHPKSYKQLGESIKDTDFYKTTKNGNFAFIFGASKRKCDETYKVDGAYEKVREFLKGLSTLSDLKMKDARSKGFITTLGGYPLAVPSNEPYKAFNYFVQGSAGIILKTAMRAIWQQVLTPRKNKPHINLLLTVHDELVFETSIGEKGKTLITECRIIMESVARSYGVPVPVSVSFHPGNWSEGEKVDI
jgi:DNA polymerase I-like protein with 3'-5' exonuclease and polymerase domains